MRVTKARSVIMAATVFGLATTSLTGCKTPGSSWAFWKKNPSPTSQLASGIPSGPQLPSAQASTATAGSTAPAFGAAAAPSYGAGSTAQAYGTPAYGAPAGAAPAGGAMPAYPEQNAVNTAAYPNTGMPAAQPVGYSNPYQGQGAADPATHNAAPTAPAGAAPQTGPYSPAYNQGGAAPAAPAYPANNPYSSTGAGTETGATAGTSVYGAAAPAAPAAASAAPVAPAPTTAAQEPAADERYSATPTDNRYAADTESTTGDRYGRRYDGAANPAGEYQPTNTSYPQGAGGAPASTGYGAPASGAAADRKDPGYRPGGTSDYIPSSNRGSSSVAPTAGGVTTASFNAPNGVDPRAVAPAYGAGSAPVQNAAPSYAAPTGN